MTVPASDVTLFIQGFANTYDPTESAEADAAAVAAWLAANGLEAPSPADVARATEFRDLVRRMLAHDGCVAKDDEIREAVNAASAAAPLVVQFREDGYVALEAAQPAGIDAVIGRLVGAIFESMADGTWLRLKLCLASDCQWAYYDASRNRSGHWCSMETCGNKAKARAYRARHKP